ncbi:hypothetical protein P7K49_014866 [Saguinus oedipus]|uniref:Uncharacterized protein n=1 Tax=Saguinus oedipus TaxID=9490 RepID=A0ABQ9VAB4_SAGOE|nr:hypothetical protein P7K49_014866 [Saguinus oedipus]
MQRHPRLEGLSGAVTHSTITVQGHQLDGALDRDQCTIHYDVDLLLHSASRQGWPGPQLLKCDPSPAFTQVFRHLASPPSDGFSFLICIMSHNSYGIRHSLGMSAFVLALGTREAALWALGGAENELPSHMQS